MNYHCWNCDKPLKLRRGFRKVKTIRCDCGAAWDHDYLVNSDPGWWEEVRRDRAFIMHVKARYLYTMTPRRTRS